MAQAPRRRRSKTAAGRDCGDCASGSGICTVRVRGSRLPARLAKDCARSSRCRSRRCRTRPEHCAMNEAARVTALIVDDEPVARAGMRHMLAEVEWIDCIGEAATGPAAVEAIDALRPELVFLDIQMPGISGIEVLRRATHQPF